jgi:hypothetical protein
MPARADVVEIRGERRIHETAITELVGGNCIERVSGDLWITDNPALELASLDVLGRLTVIYNDTLAASEADMIAAALPDIEWVKNDANGVLDGFWWLKDTSSATRVPSSKVTSRSSV